ncbi:LysR family transcriptional regulator [Solimicrobium silvestre]|uniref:Transcriptional regulator n=1 Tax=Solimicrobium silvestre TaxID=2099400 RepID=A0A2S9H060_9BURK|nr:LysR family transcriptional regulator [Solimicrobium silvestre]PRC93369.1 Transcriptional regulator [Solimicrobium silvestre]
MHLTLRQLQIFMAVAESGSTTAAAELVCLTQSASSAALRELENLLSCHLFDRVGKRLILNDNGRQLLPQARLMLDAAANIEQQFLPGTSANISGLKIGSSTTIGIYLLPSILAKYDAGLHAQPTKITIANTLDVANLVANFEVDAGFIEGPCHQTDLIIEPWLMDELIIVCSPQHPILAGQGSNKIDLVTLREAGWLLRERGSGTREAVEQALLPQLHFLNPSIEFSNSEAIKYAAAAGLGLACLSRLVVQDLLHSGQLVELSTSLPKLQRHFYLLTAKKKIVSARLAALLEFCRGWTSV